MAVVEVGDVGVGVPERLVVMRVAVTQPRRLEAGVAVGVVVVVFVLVVVVDLVVVVVFVTGVHDAEDGIVA